MSKILRVLVVEDNPADADFIHEMLPDTGPVMFHIESVERLAEAIARLDRGNIDLVLLDLGLPDSQGLDTLHQLRQAAPGIPVIVLSGNDDQGLAVTAVHDGAQDYLVKGQISANLLARTARYAYERQKTLEALQQNMEAALRAANTLRLQGTALESAANSIVITDRDGRIEWVNPAFTIQTGYSAGEAIGKNQSQLIKSGQHDAEFYRLLWETIAAGKIWRGEIVDRRKDGSLYTAELTVTPVHGLTGELTHFIGIKQDITARKQSENALRESAEHYRLLFDENPIPMWLFDPATLSFLQVNSAAIKNYGYTRKEFLAMTVKDIRSPGEIPAMGQIIIRSISETVNASDVRHRRKDGSIIQVEVVVQPMRFADRAALLVVATDVTEKKLLEQKFLHAQRLESVGMLASGIAHDLNNILAPIMLAAPMMRNHITMEPRGTRLLAMIEASATRGAALVKQILGFVHSSSDTLHPIQVKHLARDIISVLEETLPKSIQIEYAFSSDLWPAQGNATQIHQVLMNLCVNARDAMPSGGTLKLTAANCHLDDDAAAAIAGARAGTWLRLEVSDTGTGIPPDVLKKMWTPFFTTKGPGLGTGLGLSTVRSIALGHHGFIDLRTAVGQGTTIAVYLPASVGKADQPGSAPPVVPRGQGERILVADDEPSICDTISASLAEYGYAPVSCADGMEALALFYAEPDNFSLIITDVSMPRLGGLELAKTIRQMRPHLPILAMSGQSGGTEKNIEITAIKSGSDAFMNKPFKIGELLPVVHRLLHPAGKG